MQNGHAVSQVLKQRRIMNNRLLVVVRKGYRNSDVKMQIS